MHTSKLGRKKSNRRLLVKNLAASLIVNEKITTTYSKAKALQPYIERIITDAKNNNDVNALRTIFAKTGQLKPSKKVIDVIKKLVDKEKGGYTRIIKIDNRKGDNALMAIIELVHKTEEIVKPIKSTDKSTKLKKTVPKTKSAEKQS